MRHEANEDGDEGVGVKFGTKRNPTMTPEKLHNKSAVILRSAKIRTVQSNCQFRMLAAIQRFGRVCVDSSLT